MSWIYLLLAVLLAAVIFYLAKRSKVNETTPRGEDLFEMAEELTGSLPQDDLVLLVKNPYWLHLYWSLTAEQLASLAEGDGYPSLRVLNLETRQQQLIPVSAESRSWNINVSPNESYQVFLGKTTYEGDFHLWQKSNIVTLPAAGPMGEDPAWQPLPLSEEGIAGSSPIDW